jgi:hypothetical protein
MIIEGFDYTNKQFILSMYTAEMNQRRNPQKYVKLSEYAER